MRRLIRQWLGRLALFAGIVWRTWDRLPTGERIVISPRTAWQIACDVCDKTWPYPIPVIEE